MKSFNWLPVLIFLNGKKAKNGIFGFINKNCWVEIYDGKIHAFPADFKERFSISLEKAKDIYQNSLIQPTLFELQKTMTNKIIQGSFGS